MFGKISAGIQGDAKYIVNNHLVEYVTSRGIELPKTYHYALFKKEFFMNDYIKYTKVYNWSPHVDRFYLAQQALSHLYCGFLVGSTISFKKAVEKMDKTRSPGFPWNKKYKTKQTFIDNELPLIEMIVNQVMTGAPIKYSFLGVPYTCLYVQASPKGEFRPISKVCNPIASENKTRVFLAGEVCTHILSMMMYYEQNNSLLLSHHTQWVKVGFSPFYGGWNSLANYLLSSPSLANVLDKHSRLFDCFDFKHMEASLKEMILSTIYVIRNMYVLGHKSDEIIKSFLYNQICYTYLVDPEGFFCQMIGSNPSGGFNTLTDNSLAVVLVVLYTLSRGCTTVTELLTKAANHHLSILGDDSVLPRHTDFLHFVEDCHDLGFTLTQEKMGCTITEVEFLNNSFVLISGIFLPRPNFDKIRSNIYYHFKQRSWRLAYVKVAAYKVLSFYHSPYVEEARLLLNYILKEHYIDMRDESNDILSLNATLTTNLSDNQIRFMWTGDEAYMPVAFRLESVSTQESYCSQLSSRSPVFYNTIQSNFAY